MLPSGVAHTFMAAAALEKAAKVAGINIKVETQGQDGIQNRITEDDIKHAKLVILAHDIQVKEMERFSGVETIECSTKDAIKNAQALLA
ncbi:PTS system [Vibrio ishigakensis]|uniref:protein-N(pi)-phosphohistidine--D-fructose phosphotransferase n=1 Tax=Vibrio ishigakensis TaxID=1481914 RepID=A0A0B8PNN5_9VIBR|nr:PTS system [Vibrio ishigakensis]